MAEKYRTELEAYANEQAEAAKAFNPYELAKASNELRTVKDSVLGEVKYGIITLADLDILQPLLQKAATEQEKSRATLWLALRKAYPELTLEEVQAFPLMEGARLTRLVLGASTDFQLTG